MHAVAEKTKKTFLSLYTQQMSPVALLRGGQ